MKHRMGNNPMCYSCRHFTPKDEEQSAYTPTGWCSLGRFMNGRKVSDKPRTANWNEYCKRWIEVDTGLTYAEAVCRRVDTDRTPIEAMMIEKILKGETE